jgi:hypothetical protein
MKRTSLIILSSLILFAGGVWGEDGEISDTQSNSDNSIYLVCEAGKKEKWTYKPYKPGPHTIKDLLENKIDLTLDKKKKKSIKRGFKYESNISYYQEAVLDGGARLKGIPVKYIDEMLLSYLNPLFILFFFFLSNVKSILFSSRSLMVWGPGLYGLYVHFSFLPASHTK